MKQHEITIRYRRVGGNDKAEANLRAIDAKKGVVYRDRVNLASKSARQRFVRNVFERHPSADRRDINAQVQAIQTKLLDRPETAETKDKEKARASKNKTGSDKNEATRLVELAADAELFHSADGQAYATIPVEQHRENWLVDSKQFRSWLVRRFYMAVGKSPGSQARQMALDTLEGEGLHGGPKHTVSTRIAGHEQEIFLDLANKEWQAVGITADSWALVSDPAVRFRRNAGMLPLPVPASGGSIAELEPFLNARVEDSFILMVSWLLGAMAPRGPYPILVLYGGQGSGKSTVARILWSLVDPNVAQLRGEPRSDRDLMIAASNTWCLAFDNLSFVKPWQSDLLCRLATGGGYTTRKLYTNSE